MFLAGRADVLARLETALERSVRGTGRVVTVSGPVAIGKSALLHAFSERVADDGNVRVLHAVCGPLERDLPLDVARQLLQGVDTREGPGASAAKLLEDAAYTASFADGEAPNSAMLRTLRELADAIAALADAEPLALCIDDVQHADPFSLDLLVQLIRRVRRARVLVVLAEREHGSCSASGYPAFAAELDREPGHERIRLGLLPRAAVADVVADRLGAAAGARLAADAHQLSGGSPLLVHALLEDLGARDDRFRRTAPLSADAAYGRALVGCLYRLDPVALRVAQGLAILGETGETGNLAELVGLEPGTAAAAEQALHNAGLVASGRFHDPRARAAVLDTMTRAEREAAHATAARLLHIEGIPDPLVARHLAAAGGSDTPWAVRTLRAAAEASVGEGGLGTAVEYLKLAERIAATECERVSVKACLVGLEWLVDPARAGRHVPWVRKAVRENRLTGRDALLCVRYLAWYGCLDEARAAVDAGLRQCGPDADWQFAAETRTARTWLKYWYPEPDPEPDAGPLAALPATITRIEGLDLLTAVLSGDVQGDEAETRAARILQGAILDDSTLESLTSALTALVYADRTAVAKEWCAGLVGQAAARHSPIAHGLFAAVLAEIAVRQGDLPAAEEYGRTALARVRPEGWGVAVGVPLAARIVSAVARGDREAAARHLELPVPGLMFRTPAGLHYLHACGRYNLATGRLEAALHDFTTCGRLMAEWGVDLPGLVPWRVEAARAHLALGDEDAAAALLDDQLAVLPAGPSRTRGLALAVQAGTVELRRRPPLLWQAVRELQAAGDLFELSQAYGALSLAYRDLDEFGRARRAADRAANLAAACQAEQPAHTLLVSDRLAAVPDRNDPADAELPAPIPVPRARTPREPEPPRPAEESEAADLSVAERRVAALAAKGYTNREISRRLFVTVSTVEQHLTRAYRKLGVARRLDLPPWLEADIAG
ncbi:helix-turn-helix transcriptional regulator [Yinghuangia soli]|uniref:AAA family ATPase n=1 Tax=Yinghuangia soli TaxID=2908204 RepID=A0AA41TZD3_9ACTN|nr:LuxR family transcriptional regulator [Yinghuangia soli]MCF2527160.1 AAA family ATPase [Yinghuangia soli]